MYAAVVPGRYVLNKGFVNIIWCLPSAMQIGHLFIYLFLLQLPQFNILPCILKLIFFSILKMWQEMWNSPKTSTTQHHEVKFQRKFSEDQNVSMVNQSNSDQQITKNAINQNDIFDENSIRNADIIFENNDSMTKLSRQNKIKKTKNFIEDFKENQDLDLSDRKTFLAMKRKLILKRIESEIKANEAQIRIHQKTEAVQDAILKNELLKTQTLRGKMLNKPKNSGKAVSMKKVYE